MVQEIWCIWSLENQKCKYRRYTGTIDRGTHDKYYTNNRQTITAMQCGNDGTWRKQMGLEK